MYSLGCSLFHLAMFIAIFFVQKPHYEKAEEFDLAYQQSILSYCNIYGRSQNNLSTSKAILLCSYEVKFKDEDFYICRQQADNLNSLILRLQITHFFSMIICFWREIKESNVNLIG